MIKRLIYFLRMLKAKRDLGRGERLDYPGDLVPGWDSKDELSWEERK